MSDQRFHAESIQRKIEAARQEREEQARQQRLAAQQEAAKRKPHAQASGMTPIEKRILARAERHAKILVQVRAGNFKTSPKATARQRWDKAIESATVECNGNRARAVALVATKFPKLRQQLITEANPR